MFTGIIEDIGKVASLTEANLIISTKLDDIRIGDSIAVNGVCLTVTKIQNGNLTFDYSPATQDTADILGLSKGLSVNLERALQLKSRLGGHIVSGHIDGKAKITEIKKSGNFYGIVFAINNDLSKYIANKGSVALNGVSLTVYECMNDKFSVNIIPETFFKTTFHERKAGDVVNIEVDILSKYIEKILTSGKNKKSNISVEMLKENGFF